MLRNQAKSGWVRKSLVFSGSTLLAGLATGSAFGILGALVPQGARVAAGSLLGLLAVCIGGLELLNRGIELVQRDCETPQRWIQTGPYGWAVRNGLALGFGATSRLGFWLWYAIPLGAFFAASPAWGAVAYGTYGLLRGGAVWAIILWLDKVAPGGWSLWAVGRGFAARTVAATYLVILGSAVSIAVGL